MRQLRRRPEAATEGLKSAPWKVAIAAHMKERQMCSDGWLAEKFGMGVLYGVSRYVGELRPGQRPEARKLYDRLNTRTKE